MSGKEWMVKGDTGPVLASFLGLTVEETSELWGGTRAGQTKVVITFGKGGRHCPFKASSSDIDGLGDGDDLVSVGIDELHGPTAGIGGVIQLPGDGHVVPGDERRIGGDDCLNTSQDSGDGGNGQAKDSEGGGKRAELHDVCVR